MIKKKGNDNLTILNSCLDGTICGLYKLVFHFTTLSISGGRVSEKHPGASTIGRHLLDAPVAGKSCQLSSHD